MVSAVLLAWAPVVLAQPAWFADGYHGGIYGHYPSTFTQFMVDALKQHPDWKLNLEIEPETWDFARTNTPEAYQAFQTLAADQSLTGRIEFVNPAYGQSYCWNISGESVIQQLERGLRKLHAHFPNAECLTYCSEEPCFTSALPGILKSFGFQQAVLKNPNTCWGGYTRAFGGERVTWIGPDGTAIPTVPRHRIEALKAGKTWETIAAANEPAYIRAAREDGIAHPIGMCLQDAGWRFGPWLQREPGAYAPSEYVTWRQYFGSVAAQSAAPEWHLSQEDIQVSLVWGAQVLQRIAQQVRHAENQMAMAEKLATLASVYRHTPWSAAAFDEAWRTLLLAQHHDCWIVPYNGRRNDTWADKVRRWTEATGQVSEASLRQSAAAFQLSAGPGAQWAVRVFNTLAMERTNLVRVQLPDDWGGASAKVRDGAGRDLASQVLVTEGARELLFAASVPSLGYNTFWLEPAAAAPVKGATVVQEPDGTIRLETEYYRAELDPQRGGTLRSLIARKLGNRELVDAANARRFNEIRGYFVARHQFCSSAEAPAKIDVLENGPVRLRVRISSQIASNAVTQWITLAQGEPWIDCRVKIDWQGSPVIGAEPEPYGRFRPEQDRKAFYDDRFKLLALFPLNLREQKLFKNAPFDVTESRLTNTFFDAWSEIKNNVVLNWVDVLATTNGLGVALLSDHTTSYAHGPDHPLGLILQYSGIGLWGRNSSLVGPTEVRYALLPHAGNWQQAGLWMADKAWNEPLIAELIRSGTESGDFEKSLLAIEGGGWEVPTMRLSNGKVLLRLFNASPDSRPRTIRYAGPASKVELVHLNGRVIKALSLRRETAGSTVFDLALPSMAIGTLQVTP